MADAKWMKSAPPASERASEDPFAELTRIMGFDPRVPFRPGQQDAQPAMRPSQSAPHAINSPNVDVDDADLDFSLDLENELIGSFENEDGAVAGRQAGAYAYADERPANDHAHASSHDAGSHDAGSHDAGLHDVGLHDEAALHHHQQAVEAAYDMPAGWDERADQHAGDGWPSAQPQSQAYEAASYEPETYAADRASAEWQAEAPHHETDAQAYAEPSSAAYEHHDIAGDLEDVLTARLADEPAHEAEEDLAHAASQFALAEPYQAEPFQAEPAARVQADEFAHDFDTAMAEVDMDFSREPGQAVYADETVAHEASPYAADELRGSLDHDQIDHRAAEISDESVYAPLNEASAAHPLFATDRSVETTTSRDWRSSLDAAGSVEPSEPAQASTIQQSEIDEAIAELAAMVRDYDRPAQDAAPVRALQRTAVEQPAESNEVLDIETMDVPENAVALADDLDIPEVDYHAEHAPVFDDLDAELSAAFGQPLTESVKPAPVDQPAAADVDLDQAYEPFSDRQSAFAAMPFAAAALPKAGRRNEIHVMRRVPAADGQMSEFEVERDPEDDLDAQDEMAAAVPPSRRRGLMIASVVGGLAVVGVIGAFAMSGGGGIISRDPVTIKADTDPIKVKPTNPGGTAIPNQDSTVFDRAAGEKAAQPNQDALVKTDEEPVDVASKFPDTLPTDEADDGDDADADASVATAPKAEDRIDQAAAADAQADNAGETISVEPRKVRTMVVKSDGSLAPRAETPARSDATASTTAAKSLTQPKLSQPQGSEGLKQAAEADTDSSQTAAVSSDDQTVAAVAKQDAKPVKAADATQKKPADKPKTAKAVVPDSGPAVPARPADQPVDIVGEVKPQQVASAEDAAASAGSWAMQIASQPTQAAAQSTFNDLAKRYSSVLGGKSPSIVKAEIAGKGTFWRVRVPAGSRSDAVNLCEKYKAAGGNCFVSK